MKTNEIMLDYAEFYRQVSDSEMEKMIGYCDCSGQSVVAGCAAALTIIKYLEENNHG